MYQNDLLVALSDLSSSLSGRLWRLPAAYSSIPKGVQFIEEEISSTP